MKHPAISRIEDGGLRIGPEDGSGAFLRISPSGRTEVMKGEKVLSAGEAIAGDSSMIPRYREIAEILKPMANTAMEPTG